MKILRTTMLFALVGILAACCACRSGKGKIDRGLTQTRWTLIERNGQTVNTNDNFYITLDEKENRLTGRGDCNNVMGTYELKANGKIAMKGLASTRAFCANQANEDQFFRLIEEADSYRIDGDVLVLLQNGKTIAIFEGSDMY